MKRFSILSIFIYFTGLCLTSHVAGPACSENPENQVGYSISSFHLSETETQGITGWIDFFDKGGNEENVQENNNFVKKIIGFNPCLISLILRASVKYENYFSQIKGIVSTAPLIVLYHAWKFHL